MLSYSSPNPVRPLSTSRPFASGFAPIDMTFAISVTIRCKSHSLLDQNFTSPNFGNTAEQATFRILCRIAKIFADILGSFLPFCLNIQASPALIIVKTYKHASASILFSFSLLLLFKLIGFLISKPPPIPTIVLKKGFSSTKSVK